MEEIYKVTEADLIGDIEGFPIEVVQMMMVRQYEQGRKSNISAFQRDRCSGCGGFVWLDTDEGSEFWSSVIDYKDFSVFFERYPNSQSFVGLKKTKAIKTNRIKWTRQQLWVMERLPMIDGFTLEQRIGAVGDFYYSSRHITSGFDMPVLADEVERALSLFGKPMPDDSDMIQKIMALSYAVKDELRNIRRILSAFSDGNDICGIEMYTGIGSRKELMRYAKNWLKKNAWAGRHLQSSILFYGTSTSVKVSAPRIVCYIPSSYKKDDDGFFNFNGRVIIGDMSYLIQ
jgi:hypothetical protein